MIFVVIILIAVIVYLVVKEKKNQNVQQTQLNAGSEIEKVDNTAELPYRKKLLLTKNEWYFYKNLKPVADELGYTVLAKIRMADLAEVNVKEQKDYLKYFNKINKKHIDFALAKPENLQIELLIELDDNSHESKQKDRDTFVEAVYSKTGYKLLRTKGTADLKEKITEILKPAEEVKPVN